MPVSQRRRPRTRWSDAPGDLRADAGRLAAVRKSGVAAWLDAQLAPKSKVPDKAMDQLAHPLAAGSKWRSGRSGRRFEQRCVGHHGGPGRRCISRAHAGRDRQLFEVMVDFWSNHLNVTNPSDNVWDNRHDYDRDVIRKHALGSSTTCSSRQREASGDAALPQQRDRQGRAERELRA